MRRGLEANAAITTAITTAEMGECCDLKNDPKNHKKNNCRMNISTPQFDPARSSRSIGALEIFVRQLVKKL